MVLYRDLQNYPRQIYERGPLKSAEPTSFCKKIDMCLKKRTLTLTNITILHFH